MFTTFKHPHVDRKFLYILIGGLFLAFHYFIITYLNSTLLQKFIPSASVGIIYAIGALCNIVTLLNMPKIITKFSVYKTMIFLGFAEIILLFILGFSESFSIIFTAFILHHAVNPLILLCLNTYLEDYTKKSEIGRVRGLFLTTLGFASVISPMISGFFAKSEETFKNAYFFSAFFMCLFIFTIWKHLKHVHIGVYKQIDVSKELIEFLKDKNLIRIGIAGISLQLVFSWLIIYVPLFLKDVLLYSWDDIGFLISITLIPFVLFQIPVGELSDEKYGEKEILISATLLTSFAFMLFSIQNTKSFFIWAMIIFLLRTGASIMETTIESYFYKKTKGKDELIGVFSLGGPIAFIIGPLLGSFLLQYTDIQNMFPFLGLILFFLAIYLFKLKDTR